MRRALLLAHPAGHSLSPVMQQAAFDALGLDARYEAVDVPPERLTEAVRSLRGAGVLGANVTVPHKQAIAPLLDGLGEDARAIGAVNTVLVQGERLLGENTDAVGFERALAEAAVSPRGARVLLLGAGGAARAVAWALRRAGAEELLVWNRTPQRAEALAQQIGSQGRTSGAAAALRARAVARPEQAAGGCDWVVNTTSLGMVRSGGEPEESPLPEGPWRGVAVAVDIVYRPRRTRFLRDAADQGVRTVEGVGMLLHQGAVALERWTGREAPVEVMREALEGALAAEATR